MLQILPFAALACAAPASAPPAGLVPDGMAVPPGFEAGGFTVRPICVRDARMDYEALMESIDIIHAALLDGGWPPGGFTPEQNRAEIRLKELRALRRTGFTYAVVSPDGSEVLGSIYVNRGRGGPDAAVFMWVRRSAWEEGLDPVLEARVREWIEMEWPFEWVVYPGRPGTAAGPERASGRRTPGRGA